MQLSFLGWTHDRTTLASTLSECLESRFEKNWSPLTSPGFEGIFRTLGTCSSETSDFDWSFYLEVASTRLVTLIPTINSLVFRDDYLALTPGLLLGCLDLLYVVQRTPEERFMTINKSQGILTVVVWAYYILGLSILVKDMQSLEEVMFSNDAYPNPVILFKLNGVSAANDATAVCLSDKHKELLISIDRDAEGIKPMEALERLKLRGYGTVALCRLLDESLDTFIRKPATPHLVEGAEMTIAMACLISRRMARVWQETDEAGEIVINCDIKFSQIYDAARLFFAHPFSNSFADRLRYEENSTEQLFKMMRDCQTWRDMQFPPALEKRRETAKLSSGIPELCDLASTLICMAMSTNLHECVDLKLIAPGSLTDYGGNLFRKVSHMAGMIKIGSMDIFDQMRYLITRPGLFGGSASSAGWDNFMVSDFGWTISLTAYGDNDPSVVDPERICLFKGRPTSTKTLELKHSVRDEPDVPMEITPGGQLPFDPVSDRGTSTYRPRCISPVVKRTEYLASRHDGFHLSVRLSGFHSEHLDETGNRPWFHSINGYRGLHEALWKSHLAPSCSHRLEKTDLDEVTTKAKLGMGVATGAGPWTWVLRGESFEDPLPERLAVVLVKGNRRARWLAVAAALRCQGIASRKVMLRGSTSCEDCAVQAAAELPGKWAIII